MTSSKIWSIGLTLFGIKFNLHNLYLAAGMIETNVTIAKSQPFLSSRERKKTRIYSPYFLIAKNV